MLCSKRQYKQHDREKWLCEILHIACLLNSENPVQVQTKLSLNVFCWRRWGQSTTWKIHTIEQGRGRNEEEEGRWKICVSMRRRTQHPTIKAKLHYYGFGIVFSRIVSSSFGIVSMLLFTVNINFNPISFSLDESSMWSAWLRSSLHLPLFSVQKVCGHF